MKVKPQPWIPRALLLAVVCLVGACGGRDDARAAAELDALRAEVMTLRERAAATFQSDTAMGALADTDDAAILVALRVSMVRDVLAGAAEAYLDDVRLHLRPNVVVRAGDEVRVRVGPINAYAGRWDLAVTIRRIDAVLQAGRLDLAAVGADRLNITMPVHIRRASGDALIDFNWNAARLAGVVCSDFSVREPFSGIVHPRTETLRGHFELVARDGHIVARPALRERLSVSPMPTEESWERVRAILREQNRIFNCGLALSPDGLEERLRDLLTRGFRFNLPSSILRSIPLPGSIINEVEVGGRLVAVEVLPQPPRLTPEWLWLGAAVRVATGDSAPIPIGTPVTNEPR
ncbi:hypothetical protein BH23GEM9_BH23GEM9_32690 [soil metagenome]